MFGLEKHIHKAALDKDAIAELLHTSPENLQAFEDAYNTQVLEREDPEGFFQTNSRQAAARKHENDQQGMDTALEQRIIDELLTQTTVYIFDGFLDGLPETTHALWDLPTETQPVTNEEITALQPSQRPQLAGSLMKVDIDVPSYQTLLMYYKEFVSKPGTKQAQAAYWEPETMKKRFGHEADADSVHNKHDYVTYKAHEETLMRRYEENKERVAAQIACILPGLDLQGQWSIDVMQNGDDFWLIDMALAESSAFYDRVPPAFRKPSQENWLPELPEV